MNRTIKMLMVSDIFVMTGFGLIQPILAIFIKEGLIGGTILAAGVASAIYLLTKCIVQLPFSRYIDNHDKKVRWLILGTFLISLVPFIYIFSKSIYHIYVAQVFYGIAAGLAFPTWLGLWSTNLDKKHESFEWSLYSTLVSIGTALAATLGAVLAESVGFKLTFALVGCMSVIGCLFLLVLEKKKEKSSKVLVTNYKRKKYASR